MSAVTGGHGEQGGRSSARPARSPTIDFRYLLVDLGGREVGDVERAAPLRPDEVILLADEAWRVVAVLGRSATVTPV